MATRDGPAAEGEGARAGSRLFRGFLVAVCLLCWGAFGYGATHVSEVPTVLGRWSFGYFALLCGMLAFAVIATALHARPLYRRVARYRGRILGLASGVCLAFVLAEFAVRAFDPLGISYYESAKDYHTDKLPDDELNFRHRPNHRAVYGGIEYAFNELGLRDRPVRAKAPGELRVLLLGDSITLGSAVDVRDAFALGVERRLAKRLGRPVRTINSGVGGYNTTQESAFLKRHGDALAPDVVFLLYVYNDVEVNAPFDPKRFGFAGKSPPQVARALLGYSWTYRLLAHVVRHAGAAPQTFGTPAGRAASEAALREIAAWAKARDIPFGVGYWRAPGMAGFNASTWRWLSEVARELDFPIVAAACWFGPSGPEAHRISAVDSHPTPAGHARIADGIAGFVASRLLRK